MLNLPKIRTCTDKVAPPNYIENITKGYIRQYTKQNSPARGLGYFFLSALGYFRKASLRIGVQRASKHSRTGTNGIGNFFSGKKTFRF